MSCRGLVHRLECLVKPPGNAFHSDDLHLSSAIGSAFAPSVSTGSSYTREGRRQQVVGLIFAKCIACNDRHDRSCMISVCVCVNALRNRTARLCAGSFSTAGLPDCTWLDRGSVTCDSFAIRSHHSDPLTRGSVSSRLGSLHGADRV